MKTRSIPRQARDGEQSRTILALAIIALLVCTAAEAKYSGGTGEPNDPYQITTPEDLNDIGNHIEDFNKCFILVNDVNIAQYTGTQFKIIGNGTTYFTGVFDGNNHKVWNFTWSSTDRGGIGLFGYVGTGGEIKNLGLEDVNVNAGTGDYYYVGGLVGENDGSISNCYSTGAISGGGCVGGLAGVNYSSISNCYATGTVAGGNDSYALGGLVGLNYSSISNCYATGTVAGGNDSSALGGLVGWNSGGSISNCYSTGSVSSTGGDYSFYVGGLVGRNVGSISNCYSTGAVSGNYYVDGLVGWNEYDGIISNCYFLVSSGPYNGYGTPLTNEEMKQQSSFGSWDFTNEINNGTNDYWRMCVDGVDYPRLNWESIDGDFACPNGVNMEDLGYFVQRWLESDCTPINNYCGEVDMNTSGTVDMKDYAIFASHWLEETGP